jgi:hypothetical protein
MQNQTRFLLCTALNLKTLTKKLNRIYDETECSYAVSIHKGFIYWYAVIDSLVEGGNTYTFDYDNPYEQVLSA